MKALTINKGDLRHNINMIKSQTDKKLDDGKRYTLIGIVKGNGYGLGLIEYAKFLIDNGIMMLGVATIEEALELREAGIEEDIIMLSSIAIKKDMEKLVQNNIIITIGSVEAADIANDIAKKQSIRAHIKIDTGFARYGFVYSDVKTIIETIKNLDKNIKVEGMFTHFSLAYYKDNKWTKEQFDRFIKLVEILKLNDISVDMLHVCNSPAFINYPEMRLNAARIGSAFLGRVHAENNIGLKRIGILKANVIEIKDVPKGFNIGYLNSYKAKKNMKIAIIPVGYKDGYNVSSKMDMFRLIDSIRILYNNVKGVFKKQYLYVKINDKRYRVVGTVGTYHVAIDITGSDIKLGDIAYFDVSPLNIDSKLRREYI